MSRFLRRRAVLIGLVVMGFSATTMASEALSNGLGQAWPNAQDVSANGHWHVYVFTNNGIRYVQVNDLNGKLRVAFGTANGQFLVLPMGSDALRISTPQQPLATSGMAVPLNSYAETVYRGSDIRLDAIPMSDGTTRFAASTLTTSTTVAPCSDPAECNGHLN